MPTIQDFFRSINRQPQIQCEHQTREERETSLDDNVIGEDFGAKFIHHTDISGMGGRQTGQDQNRRQQID